MKTTKLTTAQKMIVGEYVRTQYQSRDPKNVRFGADGAVSVMVDAMPNTNQRGRIFAGWDTELLREAAEQ